MTWPGLWRTWPGLLWMTWPELWVTWPGLCITGPGECTTGDVVAAHGWQAGLCMVYGDVVPEGRLAGLPSTKRYVFSPVRLLTLSSIEWENIKKTSTGQPRKGKRCGMCYGHCRGRAVRCSVYAMSNLAGVSGVGVGAGVCGSVRGGDGGSPTSSDLGTSSNYCGVVILAIVYLAIA